MIIGSILKIFIKLLSVSIILQKKVTFKSLIPLKIEYSAHFNYTVNVFITIFKFLQSEYLKIC